MRPILAITYIVIISLIPLGGLAKSSSSGSGLESLKIQAGDESGNDVKAFKTELMIEASEAKAVEQAQKLIRKYRGTRLEADLQLRLAELYMRRAKTDRFFKLQRHSDTLVNLAPDRIQQAKPRKYIQDAISIYDKIAAKWPRFERMDEVLFNNAFANQQLDREARAKSLYLRLIAKYEQSPLLPDAHLAVGEMAFQNKQFSTALNHFEAIRKFPNSMVYPYGLYKGAWSRYNLHDASGALSALEEVVEFGRYVRDQKIDSRLDLRKEALVDMALFYEDVHPASKAYAYFVKQADDLDVSPVIFRLSNLYKRHSRHKDNHTLLSTFIDRESQSSSILTAFIEVMEANESLGQQGEVNRRLSELSSVCNEDSKWTKAQIPNVRLEKYSPLYELNESKAEVVTPTQVCLQVFHEKSLHYANRWLKKWKQGHNKEHYAEVTEKAFEIYLARDPKNETSAKARFVYAELLFKNNKFRKASENYAQSGQIATNSGLSHDSKYFALIALEKDVKGQWSDKDEQKFQELAKDYLGLEKQAKYSLDIRFKVALLAYEKGRYKEAAPQFLHIGDKYASKKKGLQAQDLYLDILNIQKDYEALKQYAGRLRAKEKNQKRYAKLNKIYEESYFLLVQAHEEKKDYAAAVEGYRNFAQKNPKSALAKEALWNAMQLLYKTGELSEGAKVAEHYADTYSLDKKSNDALLKAAQTYESMGQLENAASIILKLSQVDLPQRAKWLSMAADFYQLSESYKLSEPLYNKVLTIGSKDQVYHSLVNLKRVAEQKGDMLGREKWLKKLIAHGQEPEASLAALHFLEKTYAAQKYSEAFNEAKSIVGNKLASPEARSKARLVQARILAIEFKSQSVKTSVDRMNLVLQIKTEKLAKAQTAYQSAAKYGDPKVGVVALKELSEIYQKYSEDLKSMPLPKGVPEAEAPLFRSEMNKLAIPMEEKAFETKLAAYKEALAIGMRDGILRDLKNDLDKLNHQSGSQPLISLEMPAVIVPQWNKGGIGS